MGQIHYDAGQLPASYFMVALCQRILADLMVLAINAAQVAVAKKDIPRTLNPGNRGFFSKMRSMGGHDRRIPGAADPGLACSTIHTASMGTDPAVPKHPLQQVRSLSQLLGFQPFEARHL
jgi:hypothetical protein